MIKKFTSIDEVNNITSENIFKPQIALIGVGGAGTNAVNNMVNMGLTGVKFVVVNTDSKSLESSVSPYKLQIGPKVTKGLGAGSKPEIGSQAAEESIEDIRTILKDINLLFITAGMGGGTGTGASQVIAKLAKEMDILTISFVTKPFGFEGNQRTDMAEQGIIELEKYSDSLVVISNQNLFAVVDDSTSLSDAFRATDLVLYDGIKAITDLLVSSGLVNLDFNDIKYVIEGKGRAMIGSAEASGEGRASEVARRAILNPLLEDVSIIGAKSILINITGSLDMTLREVDTIINSIKQELDKDAFINFGAIHDANLLDTLRLSVVATSLQDKDKVSLLRKPQIRHENSRPTKTLKDLENDFTEREEYNSVRSDRIEERKSKISYQDMEEVDSYKSKTTKVLEEEVSFVKEEIEIYDDNLEDFSDVELEQEIPSFEMKIVEDSITFTNDNDEKNPINGNFMEEIEQEEKSNSVNLFDLIIKGKSDKEAEHANQMRENDILNIKNRNKISKETHLAEGKEDSFFDLPSFLKKGK